MPKAQEIAVLEINGTLYQDWETVSVVHQKQQSPHFSYRFTCSEAMPIAANWSVLKIKPGDLCQVTLAGQPAVLGYVNTRQVFYDAKKHYVEIQGCSDSAGLAYASAITKTMEFKNTAVEPFIRSLLKPFGIKLNIAGGKLPDFKFPRLSIAHGTTVLEAIEMPLRSLGHFPITSSPQGGLTIVAGSGGSGGDFIEGQNILEGREVIYNNGMATMLNPVSQHPGTDKVSGAAVAHVPFLEQKFEALGAIAKFFPAVVPLEVPAHQKEQLQNRAGMDVKSQNEDRVTVFVTVQGWLKPSGGLWNILETYTVKSPMLLMTGSEKLLPKTITFSQDNERGSRTLLELCNEAAMAGGTPTAGGEPDSSQTSTAETGLDVDERDPTTGLPKTG